MNNIIIVKLDSTYAAVYSGIWQWNYGQILRIQGGNLPKVVEVHFSLQDKGGDSITRIGTTVDGATDVPIPDSFLENGGRAQDYKIYAFIYLEDGTAGNTEYKIEMSVKSRPKPEVPGTPEEPELFRETVKAVNDAADRAEASEQNAKTSATEAGKYATSASESAATAEKTKEDALKEVGEKKQEAIEAIQEQEEASVGKITTHTDDEIQRILNQTAESKGELEQTITNAGVSKKELDESIQTAGDTKTALDKSTELAGTAKTEMDTSTQKAGEAKTALDGSTNTVAEMQETLSATVKQAGALDTSLGEKIETGTQLKTDLVASGEKAVQDIQAAGSEQLGKMQTVAEEFTADREQITINKENIGSLKEDLDNVKKTTICKNIFGGVPNVYYPCNIPSGTDVTVSTEDGSKFEAGTVFNLYSSDKTRKDYWNLSGLSNRTIKTNADISYVTLSKAANTNVQIEIGDKSTKYQEYFLDVKMLNKKLDNIGEDDIVNALINRAKIICGYIEKNTINGFLNNLDGSIKLDNTASQVTGFVKVIPNEILLYSGKGSASAANVCFYDKKFAFISSVNSLKYGTFEINVPSEAVYARFASRANEDGEIAELIVNIKTKPMYKNNLTGKKWYACGDSFTEGAYIFDDLKLVDRWLEDGKYAGKLKSYPYYIGNRTNCDIYNIALSGSTLAYVSSEPKKYSFSSDYGTEEPSYNNYKSVSIDADYITLWFGINDNGYSVPIGNDDDTTNTTFKGAYNIVLKYFVENCKKAKIGIIVSNNMPRAYVDATIKMANRWGIKYLDLNSDEAPLMQATLRNVCDEAKANAINKFALSQSNMHPNYYAHEFESKFIEHWLLSL